MTLNFRKKRQMFFKKLSLLYSDPEQTKRKNAVLHQFLLKKLCLYPINDQPKMTLKAQYMGFLNILCHNSQNFF